ncbi:MAG: regulatory signaling modulator protein AmpE [Gammaproteobacteria bacterium]
MNLLALFLGLLLERLLTRLLHLREMRWLDGWFDLGMDWMRRLPAPLPWMVGIAVIGIPVVPVAWVGLAFGHVLSGLLYVLFAAGVLVFSLGPRDLFEEVQAYLRVLDGGDAADAATIARGLTEAPYEVPRGGAAAMESAVLVQANHRIFGVLFWFMLLGPAGAWGFRVADLFRRRSVFEAHRRGEAPDSTILVLYEIVAWLPARALALTYAVAGSFEDAAEDWKRLYRETSDRFLRASEEVLAAAGVGAIRGRCADLDATGRARAALDLVKRSVVIWLTVISIATLLGVAA